LSEDEYWRKMDIPGVNNAVQVSGFPEHIIKWIWETERKPFEVF
jgi:hypothetical protein